jgi:uncharacterized membrane protein
MLQTLFELVEDERAYQETKWGATDPGNNEYNWAAYIGAYTNRSLIGWPGEDVPRRMRFKEDMIKVAALALAAAEKL